MSKKHEPRDKEPQAEQAAGAEAAGEGQPAGGPIADVPPEAPEDPIAALSRERDDLLARLHRVSADYLNYQKRAERDVAQAREFANEEVLKAILSVLDDMERALGAARSARDEDDPLLTGIQLVHDKVIDTLGRFGLTAIEAEGKPFDPDLHSAMMQQPTEDHPPQTVLTEVVKGYRLKGRTLRPSGVIVATAPEPQEAVPADPDDAPREQAEPPQRAQQEQPGQGGGSDG
jgi:molecular chaperone GrpE